MNSSCKIPNLCALVNWQAEKSQKNNRIGTCIKCASNSFQSKLKQLVCSAYLAQWIYLLLSGPKLFLSYLVFFFSIQFTFLFYVRYVQSKTNMRTFDDDHFENRKEFGRRCYGHRKIVPIVSLEKRHSRKNHSCVEG